MKQLKLLEIEILEKKDYFIPIRVGSFWNNNCIEYESNGDKNKSLSVKDYLDKIKPFLRDIIIITLAIDFIKMLMKRVYCIQSAAIQNLCHMIMQMKLLMNFSSHFFQDTKLVQKHQ